MYLRVHETGLLQHCTSEQWQVEQALNLFTRYLANPYLFLPSLALSTSTIENTLILLVLMFAARSTFLATFTRTQLTFHSEKPSASLLTLAFLVQLSPIALLTLPPLLLILITDPNSHLASPKALTVSLRNTLPYLGEFILYTGLLTISATLVAGDWKWVLQTWGTWYVSNETYPLNVDLRPGLSKQDYTARLNTQPWTVVVLLYRNVRPL
jgi:GPI transamidase subunit PIG-U